VNVASPTIPILNYCGRLEPNRFRMPAQRHWREFYF